MVGGRRPHGTGTRGAGTLEFRARFPRRADNSGGSNLPNGEQRDTDGDGSGDACDIDFDEDGAVDVRDLFALLRALGSAVGDPAYVEEIDLDGNGVIDRADVALFRAYLDLPPRSRGRRRGGRSRRH